MSGPRAARKEVGHAPLSQRRGAQPNGARGGGVIQVPGPHPDRVERRVQPAAQTREQARVEARIKELADDLGARNGMNRRQFLASSAGMAAAFLAMNEVFGPIFDVNRAEAANPEVAAQRASMLAGQFIFDDQTHFVRDDFKQEGLLGLAQYAKQ